MEVLFSDSFVASLKKHASLKSAVRKKVDMITLNPVRMGEPLKGNFRGYYSCSVKKNFIIIYLYCLVCRRKKDEEILLCHDCSQCTDETIKFIALGPHDKAYQKQQK
jgi:mRNA-degrading endonuclease YafQ of YafQ-DinJ toxin-antitoxin module